jgi:hypothetical protein
MKKFLAFVLTILGTFNLAEIAGADDAPAATAPVPILADSFALQGARTAAAPLAATTTETGGSTWSTIGQVVFRADGGITVSAAGPAATAVAPLSGYDMSKPICLAADVNPTGSGHVALALLSGESPGDYWTNVMLFMTLTPDGGVEIYSDKVKNKIFSTDSTAYAFKTNDYNHVELTYTPATQTVSASINGKQIAKDVPVVTPPTNIADVGLHFNEQIEANQPGIKNFQVFALP